MANYRFFYRRSRPAPEPPQQRLSSTPIMSTVVWASECFVLSSSAVAPKSGHLWSPQNRPLNNPGRTLKTAER